MQLFYILIFALYGMVIGSFLNVCIYRIPRGESVARGRSMCPACRHPLGAADLVPLFSYLFLGRRCRYCKAPISPRYALVELLTGALFVFSYLRFGMTLRAVLVCGLACCLVCVAFIDWDTQEIPDRFHAIVLALGVLRLWNVGFFGWKDALIGFFVVSVPMLVLALRLNGFGGGDIKLMASAGLFLGAWPTVVGFFLGCFAGALYAVPLLIQKKAGRKTAIPFGPFLSLGLMLSALYFDIMAVWYLRTFLL